MKPRKIETIQVVDLLRSFAILSVIAYHLNFIKPLGALSPWAADFWERASGHGYLGVSMFFVLSGFLITRLIALQPEGIWKPNLRKFYARRMGRLFPLLALVCLVGAWMVYHAASATPQYQECLKAPDAVIGAWHWLAIATFTFNWYVTLLCAHPYIGLQWDILWSLSIEEQFYLFYPLLIRHLKKETALIGFLVFFVCFGLVIRGINIFLYPATLSYNSFQNFDMIALGCLLYFAWTRFGKTLRKNAGICFALCAAGFSLMIFVYSYELPRPELWFYWFGRFLIGAGLFMFVLGAMAQSWFESKYLKILALPGHLSYGLYLLHPLVLYGLWSVLKTQNTWTSFLILTLAATFIAYLSSRFFEVPMNLLIRRLLSK